MAGKITDQTATASPVDTAEFGANEGGNDRKYTRAQIVSTLKASYDAYVISNDAAVAAKAPKANPVFSGTIDATGAILSVNTPSNATDATTKTYVDTQDNLNLSLSGGTMSGNITLNGAPSATLHAASKKYVDDLELISVDINGDTMTGLLILSADPVVNLGATTKQYTDTADALALKGPSTINCAANPNYPASTANDTIRVTAAGKIGGGSGPNVQIDDLIICHTTTISGNHATVGANFIVIQANVTTATTTTEGIVNLSTTAQVGLTGLTTDTAVTALNLGEHLQDRYTQVPLAIAAKTLSVAEAGVVLVSHDAAITTITFPDPGSIPNPLLIQYRIMKVVNGAVAFGFTFVAATGNINGAGTFSVVAAECEHTFIAVNDGTDWYIR